MALADCEAPVVMYRAYGTEQGAAVRDFRGPNSADVAAQIFRS